MLVLLKRFSIVRLFCFGVFLSLTGCASWYEMSNLPQAKNVAEFGEATSALSKSFGLGVDTIYVMATEADRLENAYSYVYEKKLLAKTTKEAPNTCVHFLNGESTSKACRCKENQKKALDAYRLKIKKAKSQGKQIKDEKNFCLKGPVIEKNYKVEAKPAGMFSRKRYKSLEGLIKAISDYGDGLASAINDGNVEKLHTAANALGASIKSYTTILPPASQPIVGPFISLFSRGTGYFMGNAYIKEVRSIMYRANPLIKRAATKLIVDFEALSGQIENKCFAWRHGQREYLTRARLDKETISDPQLLYQTFLKISKDFDQIYYLCSKFGDYPKVLRGLKSTHDALVKDGADAEFKLQRFVDDVSDILSILKTP